VSPDPKSSQKYFLRKIVPALAPGIETTVLDHALKEGNEDALVGIVYRWPVDSWREYAVELFEAAKPFPWLQRQVIFKTDEPDKFLDRKLIKDPVTELYVRARYHRNASRELIEAAIKAVNSQEQDYETSRRIGLVVWCLGRYGAFDQIKELPSQWLQN
jgi:hypothetical protein